MGAMTSMLATGYDSKPRRHMVIIKPAPCRVAHHISVTRSDIALHAPPPI
jgi:hypothetical protein